jgi:hypothetical protein
MQPVEGSRSGEGQDAAAGVGLGPGVRWRYKELSGMWCEAVTPAKSDQIPGWGTRFVESGKSVLRVGLCHLEFMRTPEKCIAKIA